MKTRVLRCSATFKPYFYRAVSIALRVRRSWTRYATSMTVFGTIGAARKMIVRPASSLRQNFRDYCGHSGSAPARFGPFNSEFGDKSRKGYYRSQFEDDWRSYCSGGTPAQSRKIIRLARS